MEDWLDKTENDSDDNGGQGTPPNSQHVRETWAKNPVHHNSAAVEHADGTFSQQSLLPNDSMSPG